MTSLYTILIKPNNVDNCIYKDILKKKRNTGIRPDIILPHFGLDFYSGDSEISSNL
jgi:hypothetical protein